MSRDPLILYLKWKNNNTLAGIKKEYAILSARLYITL